MAIQCKASIDSAAHTSLSVDIASDPGQLAGPAVTVIIYGCRRASHPGRASQQGHKILDVPQDLNKKNTLWVFIVTRRRALPPSNMPSK